MGPGSDMPRVGVTVVPTPQPQQQTSILFLCEFSQETGCNKRYSTAHARRQHYRREHLHEWVAKQQQQAAAWQANIQAWAQMQSHLMAHLSVDHTTTTGPCAPSTAMYNTQAPVFPNTVIMAGQPQPPAVRGISPIPVIGTPQAAAVYVGPGGGMSIPHANHGNVNYYPALNKAATAPAAVMGNLDHANVGGGFGIAGSASATSPSNGAQAPPAPAGGCDNCKHFAFNCLPQSGLGLGAGNTTTASARSGAAQDADSDSRSELRAIISDLKRADSGLGSLEHRRTNTWPGLALGVDRSSTVAGSTGAAAGAAGMGPLVSTTNNSAQQVAGGVAVAETTSVVSDPVAAQRSVSADLESFLRLACLSPALQSTSTPGQTSQVSHNTQRDLDDTLAQIVSGSSRASTAADVSSALLTPRRHTVACDGDDYRELEKLVSELQAAMAQQ